MYSFFCRLKKCLISENIAFFLLILSAILLVANILFEKNGCLIGGVVASIISMANVILLYLTLLAQNRNSKNNEKLIKQQRFETTLFTLMDKYTEQLSRIKFVAVLLQNPPNEGNVTINGSSFISFAKEQLSYLKEYFKKDSYIGYFDASTDSQGYDYKIDSKEIIEYDEHLRTKYITNIYRISKEQFDEFKNQIKRNDKTMLQVCYTLFYEKWGLNYDHYIKIVSTIIEYIKSNGRVFPDNDYMTIFKGIMSIREQKFLYYHSTVDRDFADKIRDTFIDEPIVKL